MKTALLTCKTFPRSRLLADELPSQKEEELEREGHWIPPSPNGTYHKLARQLYAPHNTPNSPIPDRKGQLRQPCTNPAALGLLWRRPGAPALSTAVPSSHVSSYLHFLGNRPQAELESQMSAFRMASSPSHSRVSTQKNLDIRISIQATASLLPVGGNSFSGET